MSIDLSLIIPTRDRARYLTHSLKTCLANDHAAMEILVLDNASVDDTREVVERVADERLRYLRSDTRLSMRQNFERGLDSARGDIVCFIGDDDGVFPDCASFAVDLFRKLPIDALSAARAHYFWPDFLTSRKNTALLPRHHGLDIRNSRDELKNVLFDSDYYKLPCAYHGFVKRSVLNRVRERQGGLFFLSSNVDIFSSIALAMEDLCFAYSRSPLIINGGSGRSNGASHFGGASAVEKEMWQREDELGFVSGFGDSLTMGSFIIESALRYIERSPDVGLSDIFGREALCYALLREQHHRLEAGRSLENARQPLMIAKLEQDCVPRGRRAGLSDASRLSRLMRSFRLHRPVLMESADISDIAGAAVHLAKLRNLRRTGVLCEPALQVRAAVRLARG
jgi:glycosyltransferase involved in cell wall biosynthesis